MIMAAPQRSVGKSDIEKQDKTGYILHQYSFFVNVPIIIRVKYLSLVGPSAQDIKLSVALEKVLRDYNLFESAEDSRKREEVLGKLNVIVKEWVRQVSVQKVNTI